jgi:uncharacterized membrane protein YqjE
MGNNDHDSGWTAATRRLASNAMGAVQNRIELFALELREEKNQAVNVLIWVCAAVLCGLMALVAVTAAVILFVPEDKRAYAAGGFAVLYLALAVAAYLKARGLMKDETPPFSATIDEFQKDQEWLQRK